MTSGVGDTAGLLATPSWGPGHCWEEGRQVVDQTTEQIKLLFQLRGARAAVYLSWRMFRTPRLCLLPWFCLSEREGTFTSALAAVGTTKR